MCLNAWLGAQTGKAQWSRCDVGKAPQCDDSMINK